MAKNPYNREDRLQVLRTCRSNGWRLKNSEPWRYRFQKDIDGVKLLCFHCNITHYRRGEFAVELQAVQVTPFDSPVLLIRYISAADVQLILENPRPLFDHLIQSPNTQQ